MKMTILTESQEEILDTKLYKRTKQDINELAILSMAISSLVQVMTVFQLYCDEREEDQGHVIPILNILELLIKPIDRFLQAGAPKAPEGEEEGEGAK